MLAAAVSAHHRRHGQRHRDRNQIAPYNWNGLADWLAQSNWLNNMWHAYRHQMSGVDHGLRKNGSDDKIIAAANKI